MAGMTAAPAEIKSVTVNVNAVNKVSFKQKFATYLKHPGSLALFLLVNISTVITIFVLASLVIYILINGIPNLNLDMFAWEYTTDNLSMMPAIINTLTMTVVTIAIAGPIGIFSAIYLVEYAKRGNKFVKIVRITTETLAGIPSIVFGLFGYLVFVVFFKFRYSMLSGCLTLAIMILPTIMRTTEEALKGVPDLYREGSFGLGAGRLRTVFRVILPSAVPGILSGVILAIGRIVGETAALIYTSGTVSGLPDSLMDSGRTLAIHVWALQSEGLHIDAAYATCVVLLILVLLINGLSSVIAKKMQTK